MAKLKTRLKGGPSSGHYGHAGRPGKVGGSASGTLRVGKKPSEDLQRTAMDTLMGQLGKVVASERVHTKIQRGNAIFAESLRRDVEANFPEGDRKKYALSAIGDAYVAQVATARDKAGKLVGIATLLRGTSPSGQKCISISYMATSQKGIGRQMMNKIKSVARSESAYVYAEPTSKGASASLEKMEFEPIDMTGSMGEFMVWKP
jgi:hypothetical protein